MLTIAFRNYREHAYIGFYSFWNPGLLIRNLELAQKILIKDFSKFRDNWFEVDESVDPVLAKNPFVLNGDEWKAVRGQIASQFTSKRVSENVRQQKYQIKLYGF